MSTFPDVSPVTSSPGRFVRVFRISIWWLYEHVVGLVAAVVAVLCEVPLLWVVVGVAAIEILAASAAARRQGVVASYYQLWRRGARFARRNPQFRLAFDPQIDIQKRAVLWQLHVGGKVGHSVGFDDYLPTLKRQLGEASDLRLDIDRVLVGRPKPDATALCVAVCFGQHRPAFELISAPLWSTGLGRDLSPSAADSLDEGEDGTDKER